MTTTLKTKSYYEQILSKIDARSLRKNNQQKCIHSMKKRIFVLQKFVKSAEKIRFLFAFVCFRITEISYFLSFPSNENVRNVYFCVNMKFS